jgi:ketosteroid isomerase-like protein
MPQSVLEIAQAFVAAINAEDVAALGELMTSDHTFIDALGRSFSGAETMLAGWRHFFDAFPDYRITIARAFSDGNEAALFGEAEGKWRVDGRVLDGSWRVPAAWLAVVQTGKIREWRVFCNTAWAEAPS